MKVVYDTNILISATFWRGNPFRCLLLARQRFVELYLCEEILDELTEKLQTKFGYSPEEASASREAMMSFSQIEVIESSVKVIERDPEDDKFLELAERCRVDFIVSGDRHLLDLGEFRGIPIVTAAEFLEILRH